MGATSDTKQRLIATAFRLMFTRGYNSVGVQEICAQARVNKGSFYYYFPAKRDLALAVLDYFWEIHQHRLLKPAFADDAPLAVRFRRLFELTCRLQSEVYGEDTFLGCLFGNFALELSHQDEVIRQKLQGIFQMWTDYFERILIEAVAKGELPDINTHATAQAILAYYEGTMLLAKTYKQTDMVDLLAQRVLQLAMLNKQ